jgi:hypothetical protein
MIVAKAGDDLFQYLKMYLLNEVMKVGDVSIARVNTRETINRLMETLGNDLSRLLDGYVHDDVIPMLYTGGDEDVTNARNEILNR